MTNKFEKNTNCEYCGKALDAKYRSKRFCDDKCRIYLKREFKVHDLGDGVTVKEKAVPEELQQLFKSPKKQFENAKAGLLIPKGEKEEAPKIDWIPNKGNPKNLEELKALCPKELTGFDRSDWIRTERQKYNI